MRGDRGGTTKKAPKKPPTRADKQAVVWAAEQNLKPWEVDAPKPRGKHVAPAAKPESLEHRYRVALAAPVSNRARQRLAATMTPERKKQHRESYKPPAPSRDHGFLGAVAATPGSIAHTWERFGRAAPHVAATTSEALGLTDVGRDVAQLLHPTSLIPTSTGHARSDVTKYPGSRTLKTGVLGEDLYNALQGKPHSTLWAGLGVAGLLPLPFGRAARLAKALREGEKAAEAAEEVAKVAPKLAPTSAGEKLAGKLGGAEKAVVEQEVLRSPERAARIERGGEAFKAAGGGRAGLEAKSRALAGAYPRLRFRDFHEFDPPAVDSLLNEIEDHPKLTGWQKKRAQDAIRDALESDKLPEPNQIALLRKVFGEQVTEDVIAAAEKDTSVWKNRLLNVAGIPRAWQTTLDLSYLFRQGLVAGARHPVLFSRNVVPSLRMLRSERGFAAAMNEIRSRPSFDLMDEAGIAFTELDKPLSQREEAYVSTLAEKLTGGKRFSPVRFSNRAYTGFLNKLRADMFDHLLAQAQRSGVDLSDAAEREKFLKSLGRYINSATGRGDFGKALQGHAPTMNAFLFSPRLLKSRIDFMINPAFYINAHPWVRKQQLRAALQTLGAGATVLGAAKLAGAKVSLDPSSSDFGKIRLGDTRIDIFGGFQPLFRYLASLVLNRTTSSTTGERRGLGLPVPWGPQGESFGQRTGADLLLGGLVRSKLAPVPSFVWDFFAGEDMTGEQFRWQRQAYERLVPLVVQDLIDIERETGSVPGALGATALSGLGFTVTSYPPRKKKGRGHKLQSPYSGGVGGLQSPYSGSGGLPSPYGP